MTGMCKCDTFVLFVFTELIEMISRCDRIAYICTVHYPSKIVTKTSSMYNLYIHVIIFLRVGRIGLIYSQSWVVFL